MTRPRPRSVLIAFLSLVMSVTVGTATTLAANQTKTASLTYSGSTNPGVSYTVTGACDACIPDALAQTFTGENGSFAFGAQVTTTVGALAWTSPATVGISYDDALLRQGQTLALSDVLTPGAGMVHASGHLSGTYGIYRDPAGGQNFQPTSSTSGVEKDVAWNFACALPLPGDSPRDCSSGAQTFDVADYTVFSVAGVADVNVVFKIAVSLDLTVSSAGVLTVRTLSVTGGGAPDSTSLTWLGSSPSTVADSAHLACTQPAGSEVGYALTANAAVGPAEGLGTTTALTASAVLSPIIGPNVALFDLGTFGSASTPSADISFSMTAPDASVSLGTLARNNVPPVADPGGAPGNVYGGDQGSPITFNGTASSSVCGFPTLRWDFSDGGVAFGPSPQHTFEGSGVYSGLLTATDATGLVSTATFSVVVANLPPVVSAGPDTTAAWGRPVAFNGSAVDPGTDDQPTLTYAWTFGDGSPSATGGPSVAHSYSNPGDYVATLTACDRLNACSSDSRTVHVRARTVTVGALGSTAGIFDTQGSLSASLVDEFGLPVSGRTLSFSAGGGAVGSSVSDANGLAQLAFTPELPAGTYPIGASFAGDSLYLAASGSSSTTIVAKATSLTYTGALSGGPNKTVTLSAVLVDATGRPLADRTVLFSLGSQHASATTGATGIASVQLKLAQKNGTYPLTATWTSNGSDIGRYVGSGASATFKLQAR